MTEKKSKPKKKRHQ